MDENVFLLEQDGMTSQNTFLLATVVSANSTTGTVLLQFDGTAGSSGKAYKALSSAWPLAQNDRVVVMKQSGSYLVLGKIGGKSVLPIEQGGTGETGIARSTVIDNVLTAESGWNVTSVDYLRWGKLAMLNVWATTTAEISANTTSVVATLVSGKRPPASAPVQVWLSPSNRAVLQSDGTLSVRGSSAISSGTGFTFIAVYMRA